MSLTNYDTKMLHKVKTWFGNTVYANTAVTYNAVYELSENTAQTKMQFPMINLYRIDFKRSNQQNMAARRRGIPIGNHGNTDNLEVNARYTQLDLVYQLDFYAKSSQELDDLVLQVMQAMEIIPELVVVHEDNQTKDTFTETYDLVFKGGPEEQSEFTNNDRIYRKYVQYGIDNAKVYNMVDHTKIVEVLTQINAYGTQDQEGTPVDIVGEE